MGRTAFAALGAAVALTAAVLAGCSEPAPDASTSTSASTTDACAGVSLLDCARRSSLGPWVPPTATEATEETGTPIVIGMVNQENTPAGSYPELSQAVQAGVAFVNGQLGGVDGRPIRVEVCNTQFSAEGSTACAQRFVEEGVPAVLGGIDVFGNAIDTLEDNGIPYVGGIPISTQSATSPLSFQWSGGIWGATVAFANYSIETLHAKRVAIVYGEFGSITHAAQVGEKVLTDAGVEVQLVPYPIMATDISSALAAAKSSKPDALFVLAADTGCKAGFDGVDALDIEAATFFVGACASPAIIDQVGAAKSNGAIFNVEGPINRQHPSPDWAVYAGAVAQYASGLDPVGAGTVSFRSFMNLYAILRQVKGPITPKAVIATLRAQKDAPSFMGHPYTCDGKQFPGLPGMCSPQQILAKMQDTQLAQLGGWVDVGSIYRP
jgi:branched-chain amino acid transport system substrate-binding protein